MDVRRIVPNRRNTCAVSRRHAESALIVTAVLTFGVSAASQLPARPPIVSTVHVDAPVAPMPVRIAGRRHLAYELHISNFRSSDVTLRRLTVSESARGTPLGDFRDLQIERLIGGPAKPAAGAPRRVIAGGARAVVFFWLPLHDEGPLPSMLRHRIELDVLRGAETVSVAVDGFDVNVRKENPVVLDPPLRGGPWVALYDPTLVGGHRTSVYAVDGRARIPARFAVDWVRLAPNGAHARGTGSQIEDWLGYGADVLAVSDATVVEAMDDIAEDSSVSASARLPASLENASGNFICLDLGGGRYAFYEHLKHRSIRVKRGDRVSSGQTIAQLGNSGSSSSGPHLHFHVADSASELAAEGMPYVFKGFDILGAYRGITDFVEGRRWEDADAAGSRRGELPPPNAVVQFPVTPFAAR